jgi:hypothetical protein
MQYIGVCPRCGGSLMRERDYGERDVCLSCSLVTHEEYTGPWLVDNSRPHKPKALRARMATTWRAMPVHCERCGRFISYRDLPNAVWATVPSADNSRRKYYHRGCWEMEVCE